jgi:hypothetical protein
MLFNIMPKINNPKGTAIINRGFITPSLYRIQALERACGYWKREGGQDRETIRP